ncbi:hypothetical protein B0H13DRAFT_2261450 [Mycena leptocephala]|nr:hypothetical protein B0H13DRAFT_2261450 [Mycena leptocephala]
MGAPQRRHHFATAGIQTTSGCIRSVGVDSRRSISKQKQHQSATSRKEYQQDSLKAHIFEFAFDHSTRPQAHSWTKLEEKPQKSKKLGNPSDVPPAKHHASSTASSASKPSVKPAMFTVVLTENPARVEANKYFMPNRDKSAETHRQAKHFKRCVYISLPCWSSSIKLDIVEATDVETDTSSSEEIDVEPSDFPDLVPSTDRALPATAPEPYARAAAHLPNVLRQLERVESTIETSSWTPAHLFDLAQDLLFPALALLVDFGDLNTEDGQAQFTSEFSLGPFGLAPFIDLLHRFYVLTINWKPRLPHVEIQGFVSVLNSFSTPIYAALLHFRSTIPRTSYDPAGFSTLREVLQKHVTTLEADFGSATAASAMRPSALLFGPHGIDGFVEKIIDPLFNTMPSTHPSYRPLMSFFTNFCAELTRRMTNFTKASTIGPGKKKFGTATSIKDDPDGGSGYKPVARALSINSILDSAYSF